MIEMYSARDCRDRDLRRSRRASGGQLSLQNFFFDLRFERVAQLEALVREHLDAVVLVRIVRGGDDDARVAL